MLLRKSTVLLAVLGVALMSGCGAKTAITWQDNGTPVHQHPSQDWWQYQYVYYPQTQVYFEPFSHTWYWFEDELWHEGTELPQEFSVHNVNPRIVKLHSMPPYEQHDYVASINGPYLYAYPGSLSAEYGPNIRMAQAQANRDKINRSITEYYAQQRRPDPNAAYAVAAPSAQHSQQTRSHRQRPDTRMTRAQDQNQDQQSNTAYVTAQPSDASGF